MAPDDRIIKHDKRLQRLHGCLVKRFADLVGIASVQGLQLDVHLPGGGRGLVQENGVALVFRVDQNSYPRRLPDYLADQLKTPSAEFRSQ